MDSNTKTSLILHGHFYQPPRENPATGLIEKQLSAAPFEDWNERIFHDCYQANAFSRYLDNNGRIVSITNNYSYISFNFGHTLLSWMEENHPDVHEMIIEADKESLKRLGHGNAMAQGFNHTILPLDKKEDAKLQIEWGIKDFQYRYGRDPEGMWLPEAGINETVIDLLAECGIKFVVLSPWQCKSVEDEDGSMWDLAGKPAPYSTPYILTGKTGRKISAFFYHPGLAEGISFGHALRNADTLYQTLLNIRNTEGQPLIHTATDGEIYGHHEAFGDMALAALIKKVNERNDFEFSNYGAYLEKHPATRNAVLHAGEEGKGTSWSCSHGVSRWYKDCGCHTGGQEGWNQKWRTPLRNSLNALSEKLTIVYNNEIEKIFKASLTPYQLLQRAGDTFSGKVSMRQFIDDLHKDYTFSTDDDSIVAEILTGMKNKHFAFTSCAFFFSDLSGIETKQNIKYALYAIKMLQPYSDEDLMIQFLSNLREAKSNIKSQGSGMTIAQEEMKGLSGEIEAALFFHMNRSTARVEDFTDKYGRFTLLSASDYDFNENFTAVIIDNVSLKKYTYTIIPSSNEEVEQGLMIYFSEEDRNKKKMSHIHTSHADVTLSMLSHGKKWLENAMFDLSYEDVKKTANTIRKYAMLAKAFRGKTFNTQTLENIGLAIKVIRSICTLYPEAFEWKEKEDTIGYMVNFIKAYAPSEVVKSVDEIFTSHARFLAEKIKEEGIDNSLANRIAKYLAIVFANGFSPDIKELQNEVYPYYTAEKKCTADEKALRTLYDATNFQ